MCSASCQPIHTIAIARPGRNESPVGKDIQEQTETSRAEKVQQGDGDLEGRMVSRQGRHGESECCRAEEEQRKGSEESHPVVRPSPEDECSDKAYAAAKTMSIATVAAA